MKHTIFIPGEPVAQGRPKATVVLGRARVYDPKKSRDRKATVQAHAMQYWGNRAPLSGPLGMEVVFHFTMPKSRHLMTNPRPQGWHAKKPDTDNLMKSVKDALEGIVYLNDSQVCDERAQKFVAAQGKRPGTWVVVWEVS